MHEQSISTVGTQIIIELNFNSRNTIAYILLTFKLTIYNYFTQNFWPSEKDAWVRKMKEESSSGQTVLPR